MLLQVAHSHATDRPCQLELCLVHTLQLLAGTTYVCERMTGHRQLHQELTAVQKHCRLWQLLSCIAGMTPVTATWRICYGKLRRASEPAFLSRRRAGGWWAWTMAVRKDCGCWQHASCHARKQWYRLRGRCHHRRLQSICDCMKR